MRTLVAAGLLLVVGALAAAGAQENITLGAARLAAIVAPLYISEDAPTKKRGMLASFHQLSITLGIPGAGIGPPPWVMMSEIFPLHARARGMSVASIAYGIMNFLVGFSFTAPIYSFVFVGVFSIYEMLRLIFIVFTFDFLRESASCRWRASKNICARRARSGNGAPRRRGPGGASPFLQRSGEREVRHERGDRFSGRAV